MSVKAERNNTPKRVAVWFAVVGFIIAMFCLVLAVMTNNPSISLTVCFFVGAIAFFGGCLSVTNINRVEATSSH